MLKLIRVEKESSQLQLVHSMEHKQVHQEKVNLLQILTVTMTVVWEWSLLLAVVLVVVLQRVQYLRNSLDNSRRRLSSRLMSLYLYPLSPGGYIIIRSHFDLSIGSCHYYLFKRHLFISLKIKFASLFLVIISFIGV